MTARLFRALFASCTLLALTSCAMNPVTKRPDMVMSSEKGEIEKARQLHPILLQQMGGAYDDQRLQEYVNEVGQRAAKVSQRPNLTYTFTVLDSEDINAFTTGGGYVYVSRGILGYLNSEAELLAVLGHEIGHVNARHPVKRQTQSTLAGIGAVAVGIFTGSGDLANLANYAGAAIVTGYGRDMELEADRLGAEYLARLDLKPSHMIDVVRLLKNQELFELQRARAEKREPHVYHGVFASHPDNDTRLTEVVSAANKLKSPANEADPGRERYLKAIDGVPFGASRAQGVLKANRFYHSDMGFTLAFPSGWTVQNMADRLVAASPAKDSLIQMQTQAPPPNMGPRELLSRLLANSSAGAPELLDVNGLQAYTAVARSTATPFGTGPARYAVVYYNNLAYVFAGASKASRGSPAADPLFMSTIKTFRRLRESEFALAEPNKIKTITVPQGATIADVAKNSPLKDYPVETLRLMNDLYPNKEPQAGQLLKVIE
ncbi:MAG TPA: M48 family metalloprotease [Steroidobacteraceae bacterium]|nr:M48 family metalloprotease [Steroidobacteraceae bacterium]